jgi:uncharacterized protein
MRALRLLGIALVIAVALLVWWGSHLYLLDRMVAKPALPQPWGTVGTWVIVAGAISFFLVPMAERLLAPPWCRVVGWPGSLWLGVAFLATLSLGASDVALWIASAVGSIDVAALPVQRGRAVAVLVVTLVAIAVGMRTAFTPRVQRVSIELERWPAALDGFRVVQISDVHIGPILGRSFAAWLTERVNALGPDLIAVTGDLVDGRVSCLRDEVAPFGELHARNGVYFVTGNHDHYSRADEWCAVAAELGMSVLRNRWEAIETQGERLAIAGVDDHRGDMLGGASEDLDAALAGIPENMPVLLLAHDPTTFVAASRRAIDLQLSGHTHGGQIWPFVHVVRLVVPFLAGLYDRGAARLWVSRGTGFWGPPVRLGAPGEITELTIVAKRVSR